MVVIEMLKVYSAYSALLDSGLLPVEGHLKHKLIDSFFLVNAKRFCTAFDMLQ